MQVITVLEADVASDKWNRLEDAYREAIKESTPGLVQTYLLHNTAHPTRWQIITVWKDREALNAMRQSGETPRGVLIFRAAEAEPTLSIYDVPAYRPPTGVL